MPSNKCEKNGHTILEEARYLFVVCQVISVIKQSWTKSAKKVPTCQPISSHANHVQKSAKFEPFGTKSAKLATLVRIERSGRSEVPVFQPLFERLKVGEIRQIGYHRKAPMITETAEKMPSP